MGMVERQAQALAGEPLGDRKGARLKAEIAIGRLQMDRPGVVDVGADPCRRQIGLQRITTAAADADGKDVPRRLSRPHRKHCHAHTRRHWRTSRCLPCSIALLGVAITGTPRE